MFKFVIDYIKTKFKIYKFRFKYGKYRKVHLSVEEYENIAPIPEWELRDFNEKPSGVFKDTDGELHTVPQKKFICKSNKA